MFDINAFNKDNRPTAFHWYAEQFYSVSTHTRGYNVGRFLRLRRPNEPDEFYNYRMANMQVHTLGAWLRAENKLSRITTSPKFRQDISDYLYDITIAKDHNGLNYWGWIQQVFMRRMLEDPNGYKVWMPAGEGLTNPAKKIDIEKYLVYSIYTVCDPADNGNEYIVFCRPEKKYRWGKRNENEEMEYWAIDREWYYRIVREGDKGNWVSYPYYRHGLGVLPVTPLPGFYASANTPISTKTRQASFGALHDPYANIDKGEFFKTDFPNYVSYKQTFFAGFLAGANTALVHFADAEAANLSCAYPIRVEEYTPCPEQGCGVNPMFPGQLLGDDGKFHTCNTCGGEGVLLPNPLGRYIRRRMPAGMDNPMTATEPITLIPGESASVKALYENAFAFLKMAENDVWLKDQDKVMSAEQVVAGNEGGKSMIKQIGDAVYSFIESDLRYAEMLTHGSTPYYEPIIEAPVDYDVREESELLNTLVALSGSDVPAGVKIRYEKDLCRMQANGKDEPIRIIDIKSMWDIFYGKSEMEVNSAVGIYGVNKDFGAKHASVDAVMNRLISRNGTDWLYPVEGESQQSCDARIMADMDAEFESMNLVSPDMNLFDNGEE